MKCEEARAAYLAGDSSPAHTAHLDTCPSCVDAADALAAARLTLDDPDFWEQPSPGLEDRVVTLIHGGTQSPPRRRVRGWWLAAALFVVAGLGATGWTWLRPAPADWRVALPGTAAAPQAGGWASGWNEDGGTRLEFQIEGLDPAPAGEVYEVWFSNESVHISAGTFTSGGRIDMWTGIMRKDYPRIWITLEPLDDDESPSGHTVIDTGL